MAIPREDLHRLVDALPETAMDAAQRFLGWIIEEEDDADSLPLSDIEWRSVRPSSPQAITST